MNSNLVFISCEWWKFIAYAEEYADFIAHWQSRAAVLVHNGLGELNAGGGIDRLIEY